MMKWADKVERLLQSVSEFPMCLMKLTTGRL